MTERARRNVLIVGGGGQVGLELQRRGWPEDVSVASPGRETLDLCDEAAVEGVIGSRPWNVVINAAAYTAVDKAEGDVGAAWRANALGPALLAAATARAGIPLAHVSTDYVFDGSADRPYRPDDAVRPLGVYGASKEGGEQAVRTANPRHVILRTAWVVSAHRGNFLKTMLRLGAERRELAVVADQVGNPTAAADLAEALATIALRLADDADAPVGTYHFANSGDTSWHAFAEGIFEAARRRKLKTPETVRAIGTVDYPTPAKRPANSRLATDRLEKEYGIVPRPWNEAIEPILDALASEAGVGPLAAEKASR